MLYRDGGVTVDGSPPPDRVELVPPVHGEVAGGGLHDGTVGCLVGNVEEQGAGPVVVLYPGHGRPDREILWSNMLFMPRSCH